MRFLPILLLLPMVTGLDLCHDPRTSDFHRSCATAKFAVQIPSVHGNTYHALHDTLWAVSHYLRNCARHPLTLYVPTNQDLRLCEDPNAVHQPDWGFCVAYILGKAAGAVVNTTARGPEHVGKGICYTVETILRKKVEGWPESFRGLNWFVDYGDGFGGVHLASYRLNAVVTANAFKHIRSVVRRFYGLDKAGAGSWDEINILVYDRSNAWRRKWINAKDVVKIVETIPGTRVEYINQIPSGLGKQVRLFGKVDLLIAPHGAAMSNTVFMKDGSGVVEIWKECEPEWEKGKGSEWTPWHAGLIGLRHQYVSCQRVDNVTHRANSKEIGKAALEMVKEIRRNKFKQSTRLAKKKNLEKVLMMPVALIAVPVLLIRMQARVIRHFQRRKRRTKFADLDGTAL